MCCTKCDPVPVSDMVSVWCFLWIIQGVFHKFNHILDVHIDTWYIQENEVGPIRSLWKKYLIYLVQQSIQYKCTTLFWITKKSPNGKVASIKIKVIKDTRFYMTLPDIKDQIGIYFHRESSCIYFNNGKINILTPSTWTVIVTYRN